MLCKKCSTIHFKPLEDCELPLHNFEFSDFSRSTTRESGCVFYFHHDSKDALQASAEQGCHFCGMLCGHIFAIPGRHRRSAHTYSFRYKGVVFRRSIVENWLQKEDGLQGWNDGDWIYIDFDDQVSLTTTSLAGFEDEISLMLAALTDCADHVSPSANSDSTPTTDSIASPSDVIRADSKVLLASRSPELYSPWLDCSTISPASLALTSLWLNNCLQNHTPCTEGQPPGILPTRVINVSNPHEPRIESGLGRSDPYVTLSYMWGTRRRYVTTKANETTHRKSLPLAGLPMTFKDAIYFAHMLGFQWLWIDALCIIQDDPEDVGREINDMDNIFRRSILTLFAAAGDCADAGLGVPRDPRWNKPCRLTLRTTLDGTTVKGSSYISIDCDEPTEPLYTRGWVLQEQVLSNRGLIFGSHQLVWRCLCCSSSESRPTYRGKVESLRELGSSSWGKHRDYNGGMDGFDLLRMWIMKTDPLPNRTRWQRDIHFDHWYKMVTNFSGRRLTYSSDTLPALSGLANALAKLHHCTYKAGLWLEDLQVGLVWYVAGTHMPQDRRSSFQTTGEEHTSQQDLRSDCPSWSWISQYGKVARFRRWENNADRIEHEGLSLLTTKRKRQTFTTDALEQTAPRALSLTGRVRTAIVVNTASGYELRRERPEELQYLDGASHLRILNDAKSGQIVGEIALDSDAHEHGSRFLVHCLLSTVRKKDHKWQLTCLGLLPTDLTLEEFVRIGLVSIYDASWFGEFMPYVWDEEEPSRGDLQYLRTLRVI